MPGRGVATRRRRRGKSRPQLSSGWDLRRASQGPHVTCRTISVWLLLVAADDALLGFDDVDGGVEGGVGEGALEVVAHRGRVGVDDDVLGELDELLLGRLCQLCVATS